MAKWPQNTQAAKTIKNFQRACYRKFVYANRDGKKSHGEGPPTR